MTKEKLKPGQSLLTRVRMINKVANNPAAGQDIQMELAEMIPNTSSNNPLLSRFKPTDDRIIKPKAQLAWAGVEREVFQELFDVPKELMDKITGFPVSTGQELIEGQNSLTLNILNPFVDGSQLRVQIIESTIKPSQGANPKINPQTKQVLTHNGDPIYRTTQIINNVPKQIILVHDPVEIEISTEGAAQPAATQAAAATS